VAIEPAQQLSSLNRGKRRCVLVRVRDNGNGLQPGHAFGHGLTGMRERIAALGGTLAVTSSETGLTVEAVVPTDQRSQSNVSDRKR